MKGRCRARKVCGQQAHEEAQKGGGRPPYHDVSLLKLWPCDAWDLPDGWRGVGDFFQDAGCRRLEVSERADFLTNIRRPASNVLSEGSGGLLQSLAVFE